MLERNARRELSHENADLMGDVPISHQGVVGMNVRARHVAEESSDETLLSVPAISRMVSKETWQYCARHDRKLQRDNRPYHSDRKELEMLRGGDPLQRNRRSPLPVLSTHPKEPAAEVAPPSEQATIRVF